MASLLAAILPTNPIYAQPINYNNFYIGASAGNRYSDFNDIKYSGTGIETLVPLAFPTVTGTVAASNFSSVVGSLEIGYSRSYKRFLLTSDVFINSAPKSASFKKLVPAVLETLPVETALEGSITPSFEYGLELKPGFLVTSKIALSAIIGYGRAPYKMTLSSLVGQTVYLPQDRYKAEETQKFSGERVITGIEIDYFISHSFGFNLIVKHIIHQGSDKLSFAKSGTAAHDAFQASGQLEGIGNSNLVLLGMRYYF